MTGTGLAPQAVPTALVAFGLPIFRATQAYDRVWPRGIFVSACQTFRWKLVPEDKSTGTFHRTFLPEAYCVSWRVSLRTNVGAVIVEGPERAPVRRGNSSAEIPRDEYRARNAPRSVWMITV